MRALAAAPPPSPLLAGVELPQAVLDRFWRQVRKTPTCWLWDGGRDKDGYGFFWFEGKRLLVHRLAEELARGPLPRGLFVSHTCTQNHCVRHTQRRTRPRPRRPDFDPALLDDLKWDFRAELDGGTRRAEACRRVAERYQQTPARVHGLTRNLFRKLVQLPLVFPGRRP